MFNNMRYITCVMLNRILFPILLLTAAAMPAFTESLAGKILLETSETGSLHVLLADQENFETPFSGLKGFIIPVGSGELEAGSIVFNFDDIPRGTYCIRCFLDTDGNGKLKRGVTGPAEPWE